MNDDIHPDWLTTDEDEVPVRIIERKKPATDARAVPHTQTVSRKPAAIAGILLVVGMTVFFFRGVESLRGQLGISSIIRITNEGFSPKTITVPPGGTLTWSNELPVPQYIISDTLCGTGDDCLNTATMFQGDSAGYTIPATVPPGEYDYFSPTDPNLTGTITIEGTPLPGSGIGASSTLSPPAAPNAPDTSGLPGGNDAGGEAVITATQQSLLDSIRKQLNSDNQPAGVPAGQTRAATPAPSPANIPGIPTNPYTAGNSNTYAYATPTAPSATAGSAGPAGGTIGRDLQMPFRQPGTGPEVWLVVALSILGIRRMARRAAPVVTKA